MSKPLSRGVHHLALNTDDMKMTLDFYLRVLGMPLVHALKVPPGLGTGPGNRGNPPFENRSEEHTSELQSQSNLECRLLLEKKTHRLRSFGDEHYHEDHLRHDGSEPIEVYWPLPIQRT